MNAGLQYDEEASRRVEAMYMTPDVVAQRRETLNVLSLRAGERIVDVGSGPGFLASDMGKAVGSAGRVCGVDVSDSMVALAQSRCTDQPWITFHVGDATALPFATQISTWRCRPRCMSMWLMCQCSGRTVPGPASRRTRLHYRHGLGRHRMACDGPSTHEPDHEGVERASWSIRICHAL